MKTATPIEPLEARIAPASLIFTDVDGDNVKITTSGPGTLTLGVNVLVTFGRLQRLDLTDAAFQGAKVSIVATRDPEAGGDGHVNVGLIDATGRDLGAVLVDGDLGQIVAGSGTPNRGLASLTVASLGRLGTTTGAPDLSVLVDGRLGALKVAGDIDKTFISAESLGSATIGGSLIGGPNADDGLLFSRGGMGRVKVVGDLVGGAGNESGTILSLGAIAGVTVGGSLLGGANPGTGISEFGSGAIIARGKLGPVKIGHDVRGGLGEFSGAIFSGTQIVSVIIGGSLLGALAPSSGIIETPGLCGPVTIKGDLAGGFASNSGVISARRDIVSVTIGGSLLGGSGSGSGVIGSAMGVLGPVKIGGDIEGGRDAFSGRIFGKTQIVSVNVGGSLLGGYPLLNSDPDDSGRIHSDGAIGSVKIGGDIVGGAKARSGSIEAATTLGPVTVGGSLRGGDSPDAGAILSGGAMGLVKIGRDIIAGTTGDTALVHAGGTLAGITLGGSLDGSVFRHGSIVSTNLGNLAAQITSDGAMGPVKIAGDVIGNLVNRGRIASMSTLASVTIGGTVFAGEIFSAGALGPVKIGGDLRGADSQIDLGTSSGSIEAQRIASLFIGGSIYAGVDRDSSSTQDKNGSVRAADDIGPIVIMGSLVGSIDADGDPSDGDFKPVIISARGQAGISFSAKNDVAIKSIKIGGRVELAQILAGYDTSGGSRNADAQLGPIMIGGDMIASSIVAGVETGLQFFGTTDFKMAGAVKDSLDANGAISKIASVVIKGSVFGTAATNDTATFAIVAQQLGKLSVGGTMIPRLPGASNDPIGLATKLGVTRGATTDGFDFHAFEVV